MKVKYVAQKHKAGCAVACIAMILGTSYEEVNRQFRNDFNKLGLYDKEIIGYVSEHGFSAIRKSVEGVVDVRLSNKRMAIPFADIHVVTVYTFSNSKTRHSFVMDKKGEIYDPDLPDNKDLNHYYCIHSVMGFFRDSAK